MLLFPQNPQFPQVRILRMLRISFPNKCPHFPNQSPTYCPLCFRKSWQKPFPLKMPTCFYWAASQPFRHVCPMFMAFMAVAKYFPIFFCSLRPKPLPAKDVLPLSPPVEPIHHRLRESYKIEMEEYRRKQAEYVANKESDAEQPQDRLCARFSFRPIAVLRRSIKC